MSLLRLNELADGLRKLAKESDKNGCNEMVKDMAPYIISEAIYLTGSAIISAMVVLYLESRDA